MKRQNIALLLLLSSMLVSACGDNTTSTSSNSEDSIVTSEDGTSESSTTTDSITETTTDSEPEQLYSVVFKDGDTIVAEYHDQKAGSYVDIPTLATKDRYTITGWTGVSDKDFANGKARVYETEDQVHTAIWHEMFGTENVYTATSITSTQSITVDGEKDLAYSDTVAIDVKSGTAEATAKLYVSYDVSNIYIFMEVTDSTNISHSVSGQHANSCDGVAIYLDLMHNDSLAEKNYTTGWGKAYRGEPGPMVEGIYKISRGFVATESERYSDNNGSVFDWRGWLSNTGKDADSPTVGTTKETTNGYNVEYRIDLTNINVPDEYKPKAENQFGLGVILFDQTSTSYDTKNAASNQNGIETLNLESENGPKKLSNFVYKQNKNEDRIGVTATRIRDCYTISSASTRDNLFKDTLVNKLGDNDVEILYDDDNYYFFAQQGNNTSLTFKFDDLADSISVEGTKKFSVAKAYKYFTLSYTKDGETVTEKYFISDVANGNNLTPARKLFTTKYTNEAISIDGTLDEAYDKSVAFEVATQSLIEKGTLAASGVAYSMFNDNGIYIFVDVTDPNVDTTTVNASHPEQNDSVEIWLSTTQVLPTASTAWGTDNRPDVNYCGEGAFRVRAGANSLTGGHWLFDNGSVTKEVASVVTSTGYTTEFFIGWGSFTNIKNGEIIDITININDGENNPAKTWNRHGVVATNELNWKAYLNPYYLDHIQLMGK